MTHTTGPTLKEALPSAQRVAEGRAQLEEAGVRYILSCWIDLLGVPKTKAVPLSMWENLCAGKGPEFATHSISMVPDLGPADPDQIAVPDLDSLVVCPWDKQYAWVFADLYFLDEPYAVCPRSALKRQIAAARTKGFEFFAGVEPEFTVMRYDDHGQPVKAFDDDPLQPGGLRPRRQAYGYDAEFSLDAMPFLSELIEMLDELGWGMTDVVTEGAYSQFELDFGYTDILDMADRLTFLRVLLKQVAKQHGYFINFMPKPTQGDWRNGAHLNHSIQSVKADHSGKNLLKGDDGTWDPITYQVLGGMIKHGKALSTLTLSTVNSYNGLVGRTAGFEGGTLTWAPTHICYGDNNRSASYRLPQSRYAIENRAADMTMNAYLAMAMTVGASLDGIENDIHPGSPVNTSLYDTDSEELNTDAEVEPIPVNLLESIKEFDQSSLARDVLGPIMHNSYSQYKHDEWNRYHQHVTDWEVNEYTRFF